MGLMGMCGAIGGRRWGRPLRRLLCQPSVCRRRSPSGKAPCGSRAAQRRRLREERLLTGGALPGGGGSEKKGCSWEAWCCWERRSSCPLLTKFPLPLPCPPAAHTSAARTASIPRDSPRRQRRRECIVHQPCPPINAMWPFGPRPEGIARRGGGRRIC